MRRAFGDVMNPARQKQKIPTLIGLRPPIAAHDEMLASPAGAGPHLPAIYL